MKKWILHWLWMIGIISWMGCTTPPLPTPLATVAPPPEATNPPTLIITPTFTPTPPPTPTLTATPVSLLLYVPPEWAEAGQKAVTQLATLATSWQWQQTDDLAQAVAWIDLNQQADPLALPLASEPMALAAPFTYAWDDFWYADVIAKGYPTCDPANPIPTPCWMTWRALRPPLKALRLDGLLPMDAGYPVSQTWYLHGIDGQPLAQLAAALTAHWQMPALVHLVAVGDLMLERSLGYRIAVRGELDAPFAAVMPLLQAGDITVGNLESALGEGGEPAPKSYTFLAPPAAAQSLALAGFDVVSLANNHGMDFGAELLLQGIELLNNAGVAAVGAGENAAAARAPYLLQVKGLRFAFLGYLNVPVEWNGFDNRVWEATENSIGLAWGEPELIAEDVAATQAVADLVVVMLHSGYEYAPHPSPEQQAAAEAAVAAGADLVIGHHAHILQGVAFKPQGVIVYGLGNFAFEITGPPETAILNVWLDEQGVKMVAFVPALIQPGGAPRLATDEEAFQIRQTIYTLTQSLNP